MIISTAEPTMTDTRADPYAPTDAQAEAHEDLAQLLGDPLPADWRAMDAIAARQSHLAAVAAIVGEAAIECIVSCAEAMKHGGITDTKAPAMERLVDEHVALFKAWKRYRHDTGRGDARQIVVSAWTDSAGAAVAQMLDNGFFGRFIPSMGSDPVLRSQHALRHPLVGDLADHLAALQDALQAEGGDGTSRRTQAAVEAVRESISAALGRGAEMATVQLALDWWHEATGGPKINVAEAPPTAG